MYSNGLVLKDQNLNLNFINSSHLTNSRGFFRSLKIFCYDSILAGGNKLMETTFGVTKGSWDFWSTLAPFLNVQTKDFSKKSTVQKEKKLHFLRNLIWSTTSKSVDQFIHTEDVICHTEMIKKSCLRMLKNYSTLTTHKSNHHLHLQVNQRGKLQVYCIHWSASFDLYSNFCLHRIVYQEKQIDF